MPPPEKEISHAPHEHKLSDVGGIFGDITHIKIGVIS
jgi:hypothetical protein